jgi:hypothetical protein
MNMKLKFLPLLAGLLLTGCVTRTYTVATPPSAPLPSGPTVAEVQNLVKAGISDQVIVNQIQNASTRYTLTVDQIIALKQAGASDAVLNALINSANKPAAQTSTTVIQSDTYPYVYPNVYVDPWPLGWWGWGGPYYYGGYYRGGYYWHGGGGGHHH